MISLQLENVSKIYRLGTVGTGTLSHDLNRWWAKLRGRPDPTLQVGLENNRTKSGGQCVWALKGINLEVQQGEILGIIGRNGAGKSTLLKLLSRITAPTTGVIRTRGRIASLLEVGTGFHPELTGRENIYLNGAILGMTRPEINRRLDEIVEFSGCAKYIDTPVKRYSSGMTVRLGFAVAAHLDCEILIVDEVLAVGDADFQTRCIEKMQNISGSGKTVLFVSHNMNSVTSLCKNAVIVSEGRASESMPTNIAVDKYLSSRQQKSIRLKDRTDRRGNGCLRFHDVEFSSEPRIGNGIVESGSEIELLFQIQSNLDMPIESDITVGLYTLFGQRLGVLDTLTRGKPITFAPTELIKVQLTAQLPELTPGTYYLNLFASSKGDAFDWVEQAISFSVLPSQRQCVNPTSHRPGEIYCEADVSVV